MTDTSITPEAIPELTKRSPRQSLDSLLFRQVPILSLVVFRVAFGAILLWEAELYLGSDWINEYWIRPAYHFPFEWLPWVRPWGGHGMILHFAALSVFAFMVMIGLFYRVSATLLFLTFAFVFLAEQTRYLNHFYLVSLLCFLMILVPAHRAYSVDALLRRKIRSDRVPSWSLLILQFQIGVVYVFGGIAKLNYDWLVRGEPMRHWLADRQDFPFIGQYFTTTWMPYFLGLSGMAIDLTAPLLLLFRKTRPFMFAALLAFHFMNDRLFSIGIFPWLAIVASTLFLPADWPRGLYADFRIRRTPLLSGAMLGMLTGLSFHGRLQMVPALVAALGGALVVWTFMDTFGRRRAGPAPESVTVTAPIAGRLSLICFLGAWAVVQLFLPMRHYLIPGVVGWTEEGHRFGWRMKLRSKSGRTKFYAYDPSTGTRTEIATDSLLTPWQYSELAGRPHLIHLFAGHLKERLEKEGKAGHEIRVVAYASLNLRPFTLLVDSTVDVASQPYSDFQHSPWILQLDEDDYWTRAPAPRDGAAH